MPTTPPAITAPGLSPDPTDRGTYNARAYAWMSWLKAHAVPEIAAVVLNCYNNAVEAASSAITAVAAAASAVAAAGATQWVSGTTYTLGTVVWSPANGQSYRRIIAGAGTTDPSSDGTNWARLYAGLTTVNVTASSVTATAFQALYLTYAGATPVTLPAAPVFGDIVHVIPCNGLTTNTILRNGKPIMSLAEDMTMLDPNAVVRLIYINSTIGWRTI